MSLQCCLTYHEIVSVENIAEAWKEFLNGKRARKDVCDFDLRLMDNILDLHTALRSRTYRHGGYHSFNISDPKPRVIHKASVRDRLLHHAIYRQLYPFFDRTFIADSYSCRIGEGTHKAMERFRRFAYQESKNHTRTVYVLKCDIRKFFASIDQMALMNILRSYIPDEDILWLIGRVVGSFHSTAPGKGLPLGNLTSQLLVNVYMNEFDQFVKHTLKAKHYIRYADDFATFSCDRDWLIQTLSYMKVFLHVHLKLELHPHKVSIATLTSGIDFLGWVHFPDYRVLRAATKRRMFRTVQAKEGKRETVQSYLGLLSHGNAEKLAARVLTLYPQASPEA